MSLRGNIVIDNSSRKTGKPESDDYIVKVLGEWDLEIGFEVEDLNDYRNELAKLTESFPDLFRNFDALNLVNYHKYFGVALERGGPLHINP